MTTGHVCTPAGHVWSGILARKQATLVSTPAGFIILDVIAYESVDCGHVRNISNIVTK